MQKTETGMKRANFNMDPQLFQRVQSIAKKRKTTVTNRIREYIKLGVTADEMALRGEGEVIIRDKNGRERTLLF